jgi:hypothetical protein
MARGESRIGRAIGSEIDRVIGAGVEIGRVIGAGVGKGRVIEDRARAAGRIGDRGKLQVATEVVVEGSGMIVAKGTVMNVIGEIDRPQLCVVLGSHHLW